MYSKTSPEGELEQAPYPNHWAVYLGTHDIDDAAAQVSEHNGTLIFGPVRVGEVGAMALAKDPAGAEVGFWQPGAMPGYDFTGKPGTPVWFELMTRDYDAALPFYRKIFGWEPEEMDGAEQSGFRYSTNFPLQRASAGICETQNMLPDGVPSHWRVLFQVENTDDAVVHAVELGGTLLGEVQDSPFGRLARLKDSAGAPFMVITS